MLPAYMAIRAFNIEVARIPDIVSNPTIGSMRMQFWRQTIDATFDHKPPEEPVAVLLASYLAQGHRLSKPWFHRIISTRDGKLSHPGFTDLAELESYAENTYSTLLYLTLSALPMQSVTMDHLASHIGKAAGVAAVLRGVPLLAFPPPPNSHSANPPGLGLPPNRERQGVIALPLDVMSQCGVREDEIFRQGGEANGIRDAVFDVATRASDHLITARTMAKSVRNDSYPDHEFEHITDESHQYDKPSSDAPAAEFRQSYGVLMGPALSTQLWLNRLEKADFDIFHKSLRGPEWKLPFTAWWHSRKLRL